MAIKPRRIGGKYTGSHTTLIPLAALVCDIANENPQVARISPRIIKGSLPNVNGQRRVKITDLNRGSLLLTVRDNTSLQEVYVYVDDIEVARLAIARGVRNANLHLSFGKKKDAQPV